MERRRSYGDACAAAHALDVIGERWALLVVRELLLGPKRFTDLRAGLPQVSPNVLGDRLRELEQDGVVRRRRLGPPAGTWVYELTEWGSQLEDVLRHLGRWGLRSPGFGIAGAHPVSVDSLMLALRSLFDPSASGDLCAVYRLQLGDDHLELSVGDGGLDVQRHEDGLEADVMMETDPQTFAGLLTKQVDVAAAVCAGELKVVGPIDLVERLFASFPLPASGSRTPARCPTEASAAGGSSLPEPS